MRPDQRLQVVDLGWVDAAAFPPPDCGLRLLGELGQRLAPDLLAGGQHLGAQVVHALGVARLRLGDLGLRLLDPGW
jgi:hypothetical protein